MAAKIRKRAVSLQVEARSASSDLDREYLTGMAKMLSDGADQIERDAGRRDPKGPSNAS